MFCGAQPMPSNPVNLIDVIRLLGLTSGLQLCLDARDVSSYPGSGTKWLDRSGGSYDFFLGTDGATAAPTFTGTAGMPSAYFAFDGTEYFNYDTTNAAWMEALHQSGGVWSFAGMVLAQAGGVGQGLFTDTEGQTAGTGINVMIGSGEGLSIRCRNSGASAMTSASSAPTVFNPNAWNFYAGIVNSPAGAGGGFGQLNGTAYTFDATYTSPSAGNASSTFSIGAVDGLLPLVNGSRKGFLAIWNTALTASNLNQIYQAVRQPFGI
jgi:hypothetical protein